MESPRAEEEFLTYVDRGSEKPPKLVGVRGYTFYKTIGKGKFGKVKLATHDLTAEKVI